MFINVERIKMQSVSWLTLVLGVVAVCSMIITLLTLKAAHEEANGVYNQFKRVVKESNDDERVSLIIKRSAMLQEYIVKLSREVETLKRQGTNLRGTSSA